MNKKVEKVKKEEKNGKKRKKLTKILKHTLIYIATQRTIVILALAVQILFLFYLLTALEKYSVMVQAVFQVAAAAAAIYIINRNQKAEFKIGWLVPLVFFPIFTVVIYFFLNNQYEARLVRNRYAEKCVDTKKYLIQDETVANELKAQDEGVYRYACYMNDYAGYPIQKNTEVTYFRSGEEKFEVLKTELLKAKHYIFIEMFIVDQGTLLDELIEILEKKAAEGVEVRFIYDGMGSQNLLPFNFHKRLCEKGIKTRVFQPFVALLSSIQNNRDHRKIVVIDGHTGFTGGDNFADEYVNRITRFGYWKDTAVMLKGEAVWNLTMLFLQMWEVIDIKGEPADYDAYRPHCHRLTEYKSDGFVLPYGDSPLDDEDVGELTYLNIINTAKEYVYISTPYLILNDEMSGALSFAAKRGVDVRIMVPGIPDKWYVKIMGESYFEPLIKAGVKIYEFDGFNHAKMFVSDDDKAVVGTINLDYRSLYLHFENGCFMYNMPAVADIKADFEYMFPNKCRELSLDDCKNRKKIRKVLSAFLKVLEPML